MKAVLKRVAFFILIKRQNFIIKTMLSLCETISKVHR
jgi:hypothetical protein